MYDVYLGPFHHPQNTLHLLELTQFMMNFYIELLLIVSVLRPKKSKGYLGLVRLRCSSASEKGECVKCVKINQIFDENLIKCQPKIFE